MQDKKFLGKDNSLYSNILINSKPTGGVIMSKKLFILAGVLILALALAGSSLASPPKAEKPAANTLAVCGCGKVFVPDEKTEYLSAGGKQYACCSHECHEMASQMAAKDPAAAAKQAEQKTSEHMAQMCRMNLGVANVIEVSDKGTKALCGCGKEFYLDKKTEYLMHEGMTYACCTQECHEYAVKNPAAMKKEFEKQMSAAK